MEQAQRKSILRNERGLLTLDFIFALCIALGFAVVFFAVSITLSMTEIAQYVSYSVARSYSAANENQQAQEQLGRDKFKELTDRPILKTLLSLEWFKLGPVVVGDFNSDYYPVQPPDPSVDSETFTGARVPFVANILKLHIPFLGDTATDTNTGRANISSYLLREVSTAECRDNFNKARYDKIRQLKFEGTTPYANTPPSSAKLITDNGC